MNSRESRGIFGDSELRYQHSFRGTIDTEEGGISKFLHVVHAYAFSLRNWTGENHASMRLGLLLVLSRLTEALLS